MPPATTYITPDPEEGITEVGMGGQSGRVRVVETAQSEIAVRPPC